MDRDQAFINYREGTATDEERMFVMQELERAKALSALFDDDEFEKRAVALKQAEINQVKRAKKQLLLKQINITLACVFCVMLIIGAVLGGVFGMANTYAKRNVVFDRAKCSEIAILSAVDILNNSDQNTSGIVFAESDLQVTDIDRFFNYRADIDDSYFVYEVEIESTKGGYTAEIEMEVNSATGAVTEDGIKFEMI